MSETPTRVRISFTVDLDDVPDRIASLLREAASKLQLQAGRLEEIANDVGNNPTEALQAATDVRVQLTGADLWLEDCQSLLSNYQGTRLQMAMESQTDYQGEPESEIVEQQE